MKYIYLKNYMNFSKDEKVAFFIFLEKIENYTVARQRVVFGENALLLDFPEHTDIQKVKALIEEYFAPKKNVTVEIVKNIINENGHQVLEFKEKKIRI
ncbi:MAG: hypothetical protein ABXS92_02205 [Sulfurimonas sp.]